MKARVLIVGAGVTGAAVSRFLIHGTGIRSIPQIDISVWESQSTVGGRMMVDEFMHDGKLHRCDLGAQYISQAVRNNDDNSDIYQFLCEQGTFKLLTPNSLVSEMRPDSMHGKHYLVPRGTTDIINALLGNITTSTNTTLSKLEFDESSKKLKATSRNGTSGLFDVVVLTSTSRRVLDVLNMEASPSSLKETLALSLPNDVVQQLQNVQYSSRFAMAAYFVLTSTQTQELFKQVAWRAKYVLDDEIIRYVSLENFKYEDDLTGNPINTANSGGIGSFEHDDRRVVSVLVHTSVPFGLAHMELLCACSIDTESKRSISAELMEQKSEVEKAILNSLTKETLLPMLRNFAPTHTQLIGWENSQVSRNFYAAKQAESNMKWGVTEGSTNFGGVLLRQTGSDVPSELVCEPPALLLSIEHNSCPPSNGRSADSTNESEKLPLLVLAGDAYAESNFDGCLRSARYAANAIASTLKAI